jgi:hypothetical protein
MSEEFNIKQNKRAAILTKIETDADIQLHLTELELDEDVCEVVLHVYDETLNNFVAKRILLGISDSSETLLSVTTSNDDRNI